MTMGLITPSPCCDEYSPAVMSPYPPGALIIIRESTTSSLMPRLFHEAFSRSHPPHTSHSISSCRTAWHDTWLSSTAVSPRDSCCGDPM